MKNFHKVLILIVFSAFIIQPASGQKLLRSIKNKAKNKIEERIEKRAEKKVDEKIDKELDKVESDLDKNKKQEDSTGQSSGNEETRDEHYQKRMQGILKGLGMSGEPVPVEDNYTFDNLIQMHVESFDKSGNQISTGEFITHLNPKTKSMAYEVVSGDMSEPGQGIFIVDIENQAIIILGDDNGEKTGIVYGMNSFMQSMDASYNEEEVDLSETPETYLANPNVKKTGKTKTIAGYKCEEFIYTDETSESDVWITKDLKLKTNDFFNTIFRTSLYSHGMGWGYMMEATTVEKDTGEKSTMTVTKVDKNSNKQFNLNNYQITNLGSLAIPTGNE